MSMQIHPRAGQPAIASDLVNMSKRITPYYEDRPDLHVAEQQVVFGTSGHRGLSFDRSFNEDHILAITQANSIVPTTSPCHGISKRHESIAHRLQLSSGSCHTIRSRNCWHRRSVHCPTIQHAGASIDSNRLPQTTFTTISRSDWRRGANCAPQRGQTSIVLAL
jgi:hypothetical protein